MPHDDLRADERERALISHVARSNAREAHAEAVAAKLVEVICHDEWQIQELAERWAQTSRAGVDATAAMRDERDAARAEVAALRESHRAALRDIAALEKTLADLRAGVEGLHRAVIDGEPHVRRGEILALLDEVQP